MAYKRLQLVSQIELDAVRLNALISYTYIFLYIGLHVYIHRLSDCLNQTGLQCAFNKRRIAVFDRLNMKPACAICTRPVFACLNCPVSITNFVDFLATFSARNSSWWWYSSESTALKKRISFTFLCCDDFTEIASIVWIKKKKSNFIWVISMKIYLADMFNSNSTPNGKLVSFSIIDRISRK